MGVDERSELERLLEETPAEASARQARAFDELAGDRPGSLILFGAGGLGRSTLAGLRSIGVEPLAFADNDRALWGAEVDGMPVLSPSEAMDRHGRDAVFVVTTMRGCVEGPPARAVRDQLAAFGTAPVVPVGFLFWKHADAFLPYYFVGEPAAVVRGSDRIRRAFDLMADDRSRAEFVAHVRCRLTLEYAGTSPDDMAGIYFPRDLFSLRDDEVFVDCGAFDGDAISQLIARSDGAFARIVAFEPDEASFAQLQTYVSSLPSPLAERVALVRAAVGAEQGTANFAATGDVGSSLRDDGSVQVRVLPLDGHVGDVAPTFIKMDIEGGEADALRGARETIREHAPLLAISAYHRPEDVWELPLLVHSLSEGYRFHLRPYMDACWDTVCYAIPERRHT